VSGDDDADLRALVILHATRMLGELPMSRDQAGTLLRLERTALSMAGLTADDLRRTDILGDLAKAWIAFERAWFDEDGEPMEPAVPTRRTVSPSMRP
jgi:hypothetical protein